MKINNQLLGFILDIKRYFVSINQTIIDIVDYLIAKLLPDVSMLPGVHRWFNGEPWRVWHRDWHRGANLDEATSVERLTKQCYAAIFRYCLVPTI